MPRLNPVPDPDTFSPITPQWKRPLKLTRLAALCLAALPVTAPQAQGLLGGSFDGRAALDTGIDIAAAALADALQTSRDAARAEGTRPIPPQIRQALLAWYPAELLRGIEYRVGATEDATVQSYALRLSDATAVTTIDTITFADATDAAHNTALWVHEVKHVEQIRRWGVFGFARRYVRDHLAVEAEAYASAADFKAVFGSEIPSE